MAGRRQISKGARSEARKLKFTRKEANALLRKVRRLTASLTKKERNVLIAAMGINLFVLEKMMGGGGDTVDGGGTWSHNCSHVMTEEDPVTGEQTEIQGPAGTHAEKWGDNWVWVEED